ncbi:response regulator transcription factor [Aquiflexum gelatinilyticum]|uniref:Helix-turn-helix transcriptional regulator n=1 Tax=Aquiflexum gelatinilyticum TaxID=2961943 RepID=A0A9X2P8M0_9BACT|nr:helix-turn-helix transcriptional regulator [Aquiflexum gelatinilyticum]MCR9015224.1 helix-turn-helix transcriptional regulator [Aquiflexum gelatinilyticum]
MRTLLANPDALFRFQKILLPSYALLFIGAAYILFGEVADKLEWNETVYVLVLIMAASFGISFAWARIEYSKVRVLMDKLQTAEKNKETSLQHRLNQLSFKEKEVLNHILAGKSNKEICATLFIEHSTLKSHINHIYKKLGFNSRKEIVLALK